MNMEIYTKPSLVSYFYIEILETFGPGCTSYTSVEIWRGVKLDREYPAEYKIAGLTNSTNKIIQVRRDIC